MMTIHLDLQFLCVDEPVMMTKPSVSLKNLTGSLIIKTCVCILDRTYQATLVCYSTVTACKDIARHCLTKNFNF